MTQQLALFLDHDLVTLSVRADGEWTPIASAALETGDLDAAIAELRARAQQQLGNDQGDPECLLVLPPDLVRHETVTVSETEPQAREARIRQELEGLTPYAVEDLVFDWTGEPPELVIAIAARETLEEAESFARAHGFRPTAFIGPSRPDLFPREPDFGPTQLALDVGTPSAADATRSQDHDVPPAVAATDPEDPGAGIAAEEAPFAEIQDDAVPAENGDSDSPPLDPGLIAGSEKAALVATRIGNARMEERPRPGLVRIGLAVGLAAAMAAGVYLTLGRETAETSRGESSASSAPASGIEVASERSMVEPAPADPVGAVTEQPSDPEPAMPTEPDLGVIDDPAVDLAPPRAVSPEPPAEASEPAEDASGAPRIEPTSPPAERPREITPVAAPTDQVADAPPPPQPLPPPFGTEYELDENGWIRATSEGIPMPGGFMLYAGRPEVLPPARPGGAQDAPADSPDTAPSAPESGQPEPVDPSPEPGEDDAALPPPVDPAHAALRPRPRPGEIVTAWQQQRAREQAEAEALARQIASATPQAVASSQRPVPRPAGLKPPVQTAAVDDAAAAALAATIATAVPAPEPPAPEEVVDEPEPVAPAPKIPTSTTVAKQATVANAINLRKLNLIGVFGSSANRRALIRLSNGRRIKVKVGDSLDGGKVVAIGDNELSYVKSGRTYVLRIAGEG